MLPWETDGEFVLREAMNNTQTPHTATTTAPQVEPHKEGILSNAQAVQAVEAWKHSDFLCHNYVLNGLLRMERLNLGNSPTANIKGKGDVIHI
ncbi:hypothetical protein Tco_0096840 [Tanacetum coccineum]